MKDAYKEVEIFVDSLPGGDDWWKSDSRDVFIQTGHDLLNDGLGVGAVQKVLGDLYWATRSEYGE